MVILLMMSNNASSIVFHLKYIISNMKTLFANARILTMKDGPSFLRGNLAIENDKIVYLGTEQPRVRFDRTVDCQNMILMPGLKNAHTHSAMVFLRGFGEGLPLHLWLEKVYPVEEKLKPDDVYWLSQAAFLEYIRSGTTAFFDMYYFPPSIVAAANDFGIRCTMLYTPGNEAEHTQEIENEFDKYLGRDSLITPRIGYHAEYTASPKQLDSVKTLSSRYHLPVFTHISETQKETDECLIRRRGITPTEFMDQKGFFEYGGGGYHCIYLSENDQKIFAAKKLFVISCPGSNMKLKDGTAPLSMYFREDIRIALGTDGASSNDSLSMWREMHLASKQNPDIPPYEILKMGTVNGALAMGLEHSDVLAVGKKADLILVDGQDIPYLAHEAKDDDVKAVYINGVEMKPVDKKILKEAAERTRRLLQ